MCCQLQSADWRNAQNHGYRAHCAGILGGCNAAASPSLAELLSHWPRLADGERQACDGPELARKAVDNIRA